MQDLIASLLINHSELEGCLMEFLTRNPAYCEAKKQEKELNRALEQHMPQEIIGLFLEYEAAVSAVHDMYSTGCYLFGLGLRQDIREALWEKRL